MHEVFEEREFKPAERPRDTELTLGPGLLLVLFFAFVLVCGLCFGLGYSMGHHGGPAAVAGQTPVAESAAASAKPKPTASAQSGANPQHAAVPPPPAGDAGTNTASTALSPGSAPAAFAEAAPVVKPALPPQPVAQSSSQATQATPALALMVQIAAVSHQEDADVLVGALRKRGYAVAARRDSADGLIHVRIGPFATREEAARWRQKLLGDGYNAVLQ